MLLFFFVHCYIDVCCYSPRNSCKNYSHDTFSILVVARWKIEKAWGPDLCQVRYWDMAYLCLKQNLLMGKYVHECTVHFWDFFFKSQSLVVFIIGFVFFLQLSFFLSDYSKTKQPCILPTMVWVESRGLFWLSCVAFDFKLLFKVYVYLWERTFLVDCSVVYLL